MKTYKRKAKMLRCYNRAFIDRAYNSPWDSVSIKLMLDLYRASKRIPKLHNNR